MTKSDESVTLTPDEWLATERLLRKWKLIAAVVGSVLTVLLAGASWIRSDTEAEVREQVRKEEVQKRLVAVEHGIATNSGRLENMERSLCQLLWLQGELPPWCGSP